MQVRVWGAVAVLAVVAPLGLVAPAQAATVAKPFDLNGDGYPELVVGAPYLRVGSVKEAGGVFVLPGSKATIADLAVLRAEGWDVDIAAHVRRARDLAHRGPLESALLEQRARRGEDAGVLLRLRPLAPAQRRRQPQPRAIPSFHTTIVVDSILSTLKMQAG